MSYIYIFSSTVFILTGVSLTVDVKMNRKQLTCVRLFVSVLLTHMRICYELSDRHKVDTV